MARVYPTVACGKETRELTILGHIPNAATLQAWYLDIVHVLVAASAFRELAGTPCLAEIKSSAGTLESLDYSGQACVHGIDAQLVAALIHSAQRRSEQTCHQDE